MLVVEKLRVRSPLKDIQFFHLNICPRVYPLAIGMMKEKVGMELGNYLGEFLVKPLFIVLMMFLVKMYSIFYHVD